MAAAGGYCDWECPGYNIEPKAGHHWPNEECDKYCPEEQILEDHAKGVKP